MNNSRKPLHIHFVIPAKDIKMLDRMSLIDNKSQFFLKLLDDYFSGKLDNAKSKRDDLKDQKLSQEVLKLTIENRIKLIRDCKISPDLAHQIVQGRAELKIDEDISENVLSKPHTPETVRAFTHQERILIESHYDEIKKEPYADEISFRCTHCNNRLYASTKETTIEMTRHLQAMHSDEIKKEISN